MTGVGTVERLFIAPNGAAPMREESALEAVAGAGLRGDRYFREIETGTFVGWEGAADRPSGYDLTLIEQEALEAVDREASIDLAPGVHRRNIETNGVALNHLVDRRFRAGEVVCHGVRLCEPCSHLERLTEGGVASALVHRGGLRADILEGGTIRPGDTIERIE